MCDIAFEKTKGHSGTVNRASVYAEVVIRNGSLKKILWEISQNSQEYICAGVSFLVFSCGFCEIFKNAFFVG